MVKTLALASLAFLLALAAPALAWDTMPPRYDRPSWESRPNVFGGVDIDQGFGQPKIQTRPNIFGGYDIDRGVGQPRVQCTPNIFGGLNCR